MTASLLTKSALMGAFLFLGLLSVYEGAVPDLSWWLEAPLLGLTLVVIAPVLEEWTFRRWLFDTLRIYFNRHHWASTAQFSVISLHNLDFCAVRRFTYPDARCSDGFARVAPFTCPGIAA